MIPCGVEGWSKSIAQDEAQAMRQTVFPQLSRSAAYRELVRMKHHGLRALHPRGTEPPRQFRACPLGFVHLDVFYLPRLDGKHRYAFVAGVLGGRTRPLEFEAEG